MDIFRYIIVLAVRAIMTNDCKRNEGRAPPRNSAVCPMLNGTIYQLPIFTMENMIAGILGSPAGAVLMRPQP